MSSIERFEEWLQEKPFKDYVWADKVKKDLPNERMLGWDSRNNPTLVFACLTAIKSEDGQHQGRTVVHDSECAQRFVMTYTISSVEIFELCQDAHDFTEWRYDFMGGDIRKCKTCNLHEHK